MKTYTRGGTGEIQTREGSHTYPGNPWPAGRFPKQISLGDGSSVLLRRLEHGDEGSLLAFFQAIPEGERFFLKDDVTSPAVIRHWFANQERAFGLVAVDSGRIVAEAALVRRRGQARAHLADARMVVAKEWRNCGLGTALLSALCDVARDSGLNGVLCEAVEDKQAEALAAADSLGFVRLGRIYGGAIDPKGCLHDVILLVMPLRRWRRASEY